MIAYILSFFLFMLFSVGNDTLCMQNNENVEMNYLATDLHYLTLTNEQRLHLLSQGLQQNPVTFDFTERCILLVQDTKDDLNKRLYYQASCLAIKALQTYFNNNNNGHIPAHFAIHCEYLKSLINTPHELPQEARDIPILVSQLNLLLAQTRVANNPDNDTVVRRKLLH